MLQRPLTRPLRQGDLDGLCGVYAIVNAFCALCPELDDDLVQIMFAELIKKLKAANAASATEAIYDGIDFETLLKIAKPMTPWLTRMTDIAVDVRKRDARRQFLTMQSFWDWLQHTVTAQSVIIASTLGVYNHWTVVTGVSARALRLYDSTELQLLSRRRCTLRLSFDRHVLDPNEIVVLHRTS